MAKVAQPAVIFQHRSAPVRLDDPQTDASIIRSQAATILELQGVVKQLSKLPPLHPEPEFHPVEPHRQDGIAAVSILVDRYSAAEVIRWAQNIAHMNGEIL